jgi:hypothetical protein
LRKLEGDISIDFIDDESFILKGIKEKLIPERQFILIFKNWKSLHTDMLTTRAIECSIFYKNSISMISYHSLNVFYINAVDISMSVDHPEKQNIVFAWFIFCYWKAKPLSP